MAEFLGIALLPRGDYLDLAIRLQRSMGDGHSLRPRLTQAGNLPHVTLMQGPFHEGMNHREILESIGNLTTLRGEVSAPSRGVAYQPKGWVFLNLVKTPALEEYQKACLTTVGPHMDLSAVDWDKDVSSYTRDETESYMTYGYRYVGAAFSPHITLGRTDEEGAKSLASVAAAGGLGSGDWVFDRLSFYVMGEEGAHAAQLAVFPLARAANPDHDPATPV
jgi:hypothetical protein